MALEFICSGLCVVTFAFKLFFDDSIRPFEAFNILIWLSLYIFIEILFTRHHLSPIHNSDSDALESNLMPDSLKSKISGKGDVQSSTRSKISSLHQRTSSQNEGAERLFSKESDTAYSPSRNQLLHPYFGLWLALLIPLCLLHRGSRGSLEQSLMRHFLLVLPLISITHLAIPDSGHSSANPQLRAYRNYLTSLHEIVFSKYTLVAALLTSLVLAVEFISAGVERFLNSDNFLLLLGLIVCFLVSSAVFDQLLQFNSLTHVHSNRPEGSALNGQTSVTASDSKPAASGRDSDSDVEDATGDAATSEPVSWSISVGEAALVSQLVFLQLGSLANAFWRGASSVGPHVFLSTVLQLACLLCGGVLLFARRVPLQENLLVRRVPHLALLCLPLALFVTAARLPTSANALVSYFTSHTRLVLFTFWAAMTALSLLVLYVAHRRLATGAAGAGAGAVCARLTLRKLFHLAVVVIFIPGLMLERRFLGVAALGALFLFLYLETTRHYSLFVASSALGTHVQAAIASVLNESERGAALVLSHVYLLGGMAAGLWLDAFTEASTGASVTWSLARPAELHRVLALWGGVLVVGAGDTLGALVGLRVGRRRWPTARKTLEGSCAFLGGVFGATSLVALLTLVSSGVGYRIELDAAALQASVRAICAPKVLASLVGAALLEANTALCDNLLLPLFFYSLLAI